LVISYTLRIFKIAEVMAPGPVNFHLSHWDQMHACPHSIWLAQGGGKNILINTGLPGDPQDLEILNAACRSFHPLNFFDPDHISAPTDVLDQAGITPEDIDVIIIIGMAAYATGNIELFPNADVWMSRKGWVDFMAPARPPELHREVIFTDATMTHLYTRAWDRIRLVDDEQEIMPGLGMFWVGAHHRGSMAVSIRTARGVVVICDSIFRYENYDPGTPIGALENLSEFHDALDRIRREADIVIPGHDNKVFENYPDGIIV